MEVDTSVQVVAHMPRLTVAQSWKRQSTGNKIAWVFLACLIGFIVWVFSIVDFVDVPKQAKDDTFSKHVMVQTICKTAVEGSLKSPSSADFPFNTPVSGSGTMFTVSSHVEATNTFNAVVRTHYFCQVELIGSDINARDSWRLVALQLN